ncbi:MAG: hypothetical protein ABSA02_19205 [Trebonia sp.]
MTTWGAMSRQTLGQMAGAHAEITDPTRHHRAAGATAATIVTAPVLGPLAVLGALSKKSKAIAFVVFENGKVHQVNLDGNMQIRMAHSEVVKFNALAASGSTSLSDPRIEGGPGLRPEAALPPLRTRLQTHRMAPCTTCTWRTAASLARS